jgi:hypothetical protein
VIFDLPGAGRKVKLVFQDRPLANFRFDLPASSPRFGLFRKCARQSP